ncbi:lymphocyte cytosolic protein 2a [Sardina pilchardus]|uniref:lymphocyte cytosolic protein 2a n=1 Tax=Sardina pilchardus TaxID=27697 RepID=UPI002E0E2534
MSSEGIPLKSEVMNWNPSILAGFFAKRRDLQGCDKVIMKNNINGQRFLNMSENDLQKFPKLSVPLISKISREINMNVGKRGIFPKRPGATKFEQEFVQPVGWDEDEFDSDDDYESPNSEEDGDDDYESPTDGPEDQEHADSDYEPPPSEKNETIHPICAAKPIPDSDYIDDTRPRNTGRPPVPPERPGPGPALPFPRPTVRPKADQSPQRPVSRPQNKMPPGPAAPRVDRSKKPSTLERVAPSGRRPPVPDKDAFSKPPLPGLGVQRSVSAAGRSFPLSRVGGGAEISEPPRPFGANTFPLPRNPSPRPSPPGPPGDRPSSGGSGGSNSLPSQGKHSRIGNPMRPHDSGQDMDPAWYLGQVTRGQAENKLRSINMDGAYLVRDSSKGTAAQPYTLMVLYQDKVYNIQIRYDAQQQSFLLGTGLKATERFPTVRNIIENYSQMPLLLIDAKNRGSGQQNQCPLLHPAGH